MHKTHPEAAIPYAEAGITPMPGMQVMPDVVGMTVLRGLYFADDGLEQVKRQQAAAQAVEDRRAAEAARRETVAAQRELQKDAQQQQD